MYLQFLRYGTRVYLPVGDLRDVWTGGRRVGRVRVMQGVNGLDVRAWLLGDQFAGRVCGEVGFPGRRRVAGGLIVQIHEKEATTQHHHDAGDDCDVADPDPALAYLRLLRQLSLLLRLLPLSRLLRGLQ